jgi:hypothetical protein
MAGWSYGASMWWLKGSALMLRHGAGSISIVMKAAVTMIDITGSGLHFHTLVLL